jgi:tetratricopeptide (TPR) repeat protein
MRAWLTIVMLSIAAPSLAAQQEAAPSDSRTERVELWLTAILRHQPGEFDESALQVARLTRGALQTLSDDVIALTLLIRDPRLSYFTARTPAQRTPQQIRYTPRQMDRMRILMCAAAGIVDGRFCRERKARAQLDADLIELGDRVAAARKQGDGDNYLMRRGAMLHADIAMWTTAALADGGPQEPGASDRLTVSVDDGRQMSTYYGALHWEIARSLVDAVRPRGDPMVRLWYHATAAWMQARGYHEYDHLGQGLRLFPKDADLLFLAGCEHETFARPSIQAATRSVNLPAGFELAVKTADAEMREAERLFQAALAANPDHVEARLRLGRALLLRGRARDAAAELRRASGAAGDDLTKYFASLFLGAADEALGELDAARASYAAAAALYPNAQSPRLALSALARRRGDRAAALSALEQAFALAAVFPDGDDPWWSYDREAGRDAGVLLDRLRGLFQETSP